MKEKNFEVTYTITGVIAVSAYDPEDAEERVAELYPGELLDCSDITDFEVKKVEEP